MTFGAATVTSALGAPLASAREHLSRVTANLPGPRSPSSGLPSVAVPLHSALTLPPWTLPPCGPTIVNFTKKKLGSFFYARIKNPSHHKSRTWMRPGYLEAPSPATKPGNGRRQTAASPINTRLGRSFVVKGFHRSLVYVPMHSSLGSSRLQGLTWKCKYRSLCCSGRGCR